MAAAISIADKIPTGMNHRDQQPAHQIPVWTQGYKLWSPDKQYCASYAGTEFGMGSPTIGHVSLKKSDDGRPLYASASWAQACFSDDSRYFLHARASAEGDSGYRVIAVIDCQTGKEQWVQEKSAGELIEIKNAGLVFSICGVSVATLEDLSFDVSRSVLETNG
jgi:hypothetical protein